MVYTDENMGFGGTVSLQRAATSPCSIDWDTRGVEDVYKVDFGDGLDRIFFTSHVPGNHGGSTMLYVFNPVRCEMISASTSGGGHNPFDGFREYDPSHNYLTPGMAKERKFLETVRYQFGYDDEKSVASSDDAWNAVRFWVIQNGHIDGIDVVIPDQGTLKIKRHSPPIMGPGISTSTLKVMDEADQFLALKTMGEDDQFLYQAYWYSYLLAKDKRTNEWFVLFVPPGSEAVVDVHSDGKLVRIETANDSSTPKADRHVFEVSLNSFTYNRKR